MAPNGAAVWAPDSRGVAIHAERDPWTGAPADLWVVRSLDAAGAPLEPLRELRPYGWQFAFGIGVAWSHLPDDTPPVTTAEIRPGANANGWHRDDVTVALGQASARRDARLGHERRDELTRWGFHESSEGGLSVATIDGQRS